MVSPCSIFFAWLFGGILVAHEQLAALLAPLTTPPPPPPAMNTPPLAKYQHI